MKAGKNILSAARLRRLRAQGYVNESDQQLSDMAFGIRFAYRACLAVVLVAMGTQSVALFSMMMCIAFLGVVLPKHPFDYLYNLTLSRWLNKPKLPKRSMQLKFACIMATIWLASVIVLLAGGFAAAATALAGLLAITAALPGTIDYCVPSLIYNTFIQWKHGQVPAQ